MKKELSDSAKYMIEKLCLKYKTSKFNIEDAKNFLKTNYNFTDIDFSQAWQELFTLGSDNSNLYNGYIGRVNDDFIILHKGLLYMPKPKEKTPWTHAEIISLASVALSIVLAIIGSLK